MKGGGGFGSFIYGLRRRIREGTGSRLRLSPALPIPLNGSGGMSESEACAPDAATRDWDSSEAPNRSPDPKSPTMCLDFNYVASKNIIQGLKRSDPNLDSLLDRARTDDGDALFAGSLVLLGGFDLAPMDEVESIEWTRRGAATKHPACSVAYV